MSFDENNRTPIGVSSFRTGYGPKRKIAMTFAENSPHTRQEFKDEADINTIMARYQRTGELPQLNLTAPQYLQLDGATFQEHMEFVAEAQSMFEELPSRIRNRFDNDPAKFLDFTSNENNRQELARMGLLSASATQEALTHRGANNATSAPLQEPQNTPPQNTPQTAPPSAPGA